MAYPPPLGARCNLVQSTAIWCNASAMKQGREIAAGDSMPWRSDDFAFNRVGAWRTRIGWVGLTPRHQDAKAQRSWAKSSERWAASSILRVGSFVFTFFFWSRIG